MTEDRQQIPVRIAPAIKRALEQRSRENRRSVTREVENILAQALGVGATPAPVRVEGSQS
jgi:hypothetical protein